MPRIGFGYNIIHIHTLTHIYVSLIPAAFSEVWSHRILRCALRAHNELCFCVYCNMYIRCINDLFLKTGYFIIVCWKRVYVDFSDGNLCIYTNIYVYSILYRI